MSGRGRGKRSGSGPGPGRPPKNPNLNISKPQAQLQPPTTTPEESNYNYINSEQVINKPSGAGNGLIDILNQLDSGKRNEMLSLVGQYKGRSLSLNDFMMKARELLGERLYGQLARDMSNAAAVRGSGAISASGPSFGASIPFNVPTISGIPSIPSMIPSISGMASMPGIPMRSQAPVPGGMHSMPQIYGNSQIPQNLQYSYNNPNSNSNTNTNPNSNNLSVEVDVSKMDTSSLQDVIQYSGVDLKAEAELLYKENDNASNSMNNYNNMNSGSISVDHRLKFDYFFNPFKFRAIVQHALQRQFFSNTLQNSNSNVNTNTSTSSNDSKLNKPLGITEEAVHLLGIAIQKRLIGVLRRLAEISRHRVDYGRGRFKIKIENDPKKQIWLQEKLFIEGVGEDKDKRRTSSSTTLSNIASTNQTLLNPPTSALNKNTSNSQQSKLSTGPNQSTNSSQNSSGASGNAATNAGTEDTVKTKLANVTAMAALGIRQKSWMSSATLNTNQTSSSSTGNSSNSNSQTSPSSSTAGSEEKDSEANQHPLANFYSLPSCTPLTDSELRAQYYNRTISTVDLINCMESDSHLKRSRLLFVLYESLPRENKENKENKDNSEGQ